MNIYYTTSISTNSEQNKPELSIGGYKSSTLVPNDILSNIINDTSLYSIDKQTPYYIGLVIKNETEFNLINVLFWFEYPENGIIEMEIAAVDLNSSGAMERISNQYSRPYNATFYKANGEDNAVSLGEISVNEEIGIWLKISYNKSIIKNNATNNSIIDNFNNENYESIKSMSIKINWSEEIYYGGGLGVGNM